MTRFDEVARFRDMAIRAKKVERKKEGNVLSVDTEYAIESYRSSFWLLKVAGCFQPGDADLLRWMRTAEGDAGDGSLEEVHDAIERLLIRMEKAAEIMEE